VTGARAWLLAVVAFVAGGSLVALAMPHAAMPAAPVVAPAASPAPAPAASASAGDAPGDDDADDWPADAPSPEQILYAQPAMMARAVAALRPRVAGKPNLYLLAFAGDGGEDVFRNEAEYAGQLFARRFDADGHTLVLENNPATLTTHPLASWSNLDTALGALAHVMDREQDILLLYITTHGGEDHSLLLDQGPLPLDQLDPAGLAGMLAAHGMRWKVVVVNACYSGGFVPALRGDGTAVLTAARADRSSFGCGADSDATYFGRAWLVDALNRSDDPVAAFALARTEIDAWEKADKLTPSEPQRDVGAGIEGQLAKWRLGFTPGAAVPFRP
jgi:hypothetical protein